MSAAVKSAKAPADAQAPSSDASATPVPFPPDMMSHWMSAASANAQAMRDEWAAFVVRRMEHDRMTLQRFARCRDMVEASRVQLDWFTEAMNSYLEESRRLSALAGGTAQAPGRGIRVVEVA